MGGVIAKMEHVKILVIERDREERERVADEIPVLGEIKPEKNCQLP